MPIRPLYPHRRQVPSLSAAVGINTAGTTIAIDTQAATGSLVVDSSASTAAADVPAQLPTITVTPSPKATSSTAPPPASTSAAAAAPASDTDNQIPIGTVVGACIGAFAALGLLICLVLWCGKREKDAKRRGARNISGDSDRRRSRLEPWARLGDDEDRWEGQTARPETREVGEEEKFNMFKKSPSIRTRASEKSASEYELPPVPVSSYYPGLAEELSGAGAPPRKFMGRAESTPTVSWDGETVGDDSFLSMRSLRMSNGGAMSPVKDLAIPTPPTTVSHAQNHKWESAEVVRPEDLEVSNPFDDEPVQRRKSVNNPFFGAQDARPRSKSLRVSSTSAANPFADENGAVQTPPKAVTKRTTRNADSVMTARSSVTYTTHRAMRSLIAALDLPTEEEPGVPDLHKELRVSAQPSMMSTSTYGDEEVMSVGQFPLPPGTSTVTHNE